MGGGQAIAMTASPGSWNSVAGTLAIDSTQGAGTTITLDLPLATNEALNDAA